MERGRKRHLGQVLQFAGGRHQPEPRPDRQAPERLAKGFDECWRERCVGPVKTSSDGSVDQPIGDDRLPHSGGCIRVELEQPPVAGLILQEIEPPPSAENE